jgi:uncharacterized protein YqeY
MLKAQLTDDLKQAMLSGDKPRAELLNMLKSAILYKEVEMGSREVGLEDTQIIEVLRKEAKKRQEAADMYAQAGDSERQQKELSEKQIIDMYLPAQMSEEDLLPIVTTIVEELKPEGMKDMGRVIGAVKAKAPTADGSMVAQLVKQKLS